jgi:hypothetical protein
MAEKSSSNYRDPFLSLLSLLFIYLKLTGQIDWSWWLVLAPLFVVPGAICVTISFAGLAVIVMKLFIAFRVKLGIR